MGSRCSTSLTEGTGEDNQRMAQPESSNVVTKPGGEPVRVAMNDAPVVTTETTRPRLHGVDANPLVATRTHISSQSDGSLQNVGAAATDPQPNSNGQPQDKPPPLTCFRAVPPPSSPTSHPQPEEHRTRHSQHDASETDDSARSPLGAPESPNSPAEGISRSHRAKKHRHHNQMRASPSSASFATVLDDVSRDVADESFRRSQQQQHRMSTSSTASSLSASGSLSHVDLTTHNSARKTLFAAISDQTAMQHARQAAREGKQSNPGGGAATTSPQSPLTKERRIPSAGGVQRDGKETEALDGDTDVPGQSLFAELKEKRQQQKTSSTHFGAVVQEVDDDDDE